MELTGAVSYTGVLYSVNLSCKYNCKLYPNDGIFLDLHQEVVETYLLSSVTNSYCTALSSCPVHQSLPHIHKITFSLSFITSFKHIYVVIFSTLKQEFVSQFKACLPVLLQTVETWYTPEQTQGTRQYVNQLHESNPSSAPVSLQKWGTETQL